MSDDVRRESLFDCDVCGVRGADTGHTCCEEIVFVPEADYDRLRAELAEAKAKLEELGIFDDDNDENPTGVVSFDGGFFYE